MTPKEYRTMTVTSPTSVAPVDGADGRRASSMADPMPIALGLFAFALGVYAVRFIGIDASTASAGSVTEGLNYAVLVAGIAEAVAGLFGIARGIDYAAYVTTTFGIWLIGFYFLVTKGAESKEFTPNALAWYVLVLLVPVVILAVPAFVHRNIPFAIAFVGLIVLLLFLGLGYHGVYNAVVDAQANKTAPDFGSNIGLLKVSGWAGLVAAAAIWFAMAVEVYTITGVLKKR